MRKFLIAAHGSFSSGIKSSLDIIIGQMENVFIIDAYVDGNKSIEDSLNAILVHVHPEDELVVFSDLMGGSITNQILRYALKENVHVVSGINLPLLIDVMLADPGTPIVEVIEGAIGNAKDQVVYVNKLIANKAGKEND
jgi:mannose/fructose-specific phosphotransferase system component IIA